MHDFSKLYTGLNDAGQLDWLNEYCKRLFSGCGELQVLKESSITRYKVAERKVGIAPHQKYFSIYFRETRAPLFYRSRSNHCKSGKYTINIPWFDESEELLLKSILELALGICDELQEQEEEDWDDDLGAEPEDDW